MGANSLTRRVVKKLIYPLMTEDRYTYLVALSKAWDIRTGQYPEPELDLVPLAVHSGDTVIDLGANFGFYSYPLSRAVGPTGLVYAFEPVPFTYRTLRIVAKLLRFRNVEIVPKGCSDRAGVITFEVPLQESGAFMAGLAHIGGRKEDRPGKETQVRWKQTREVSAEVIRLDDFLPPLADLTFIKADVEGAELFAFRGAQETLAKYLPTVLCEINPWYLEGFGATVHDLVTFFFDKGYKLYHYENQKLTTVPESAVVEDNYVFVHPSRAHRLKSVIDMHLPVSL
jgi:FkbM family methyltransferase